jgi:hypothetical protein
MSRSWRKEQHPRITPDDVKFSDFAGVVNTRSRKDLGLKALYVGDNVVISDTKKIVRREGYSVLRSDNVKSVYAVGDRLYVVAGTSLLRVVDPTHDNTLGTVSGTNFLWDDINGDAYFLSDTDAGIARRDTLLPWRLTIPTITSAVAISTGDGSVTAYRMGETYVDATFRICATYETADGRETAPSDVLALTAHPLTNLIQVTVPTAYARTHIYATSADGTALRLVASTTGATATFNPAVFGRDLTTFPSASLPTGVRHLAFMTGRCYAAQYLQSLDQSVVWFSKPLSYHLWDTSKDYLLVPGQLAMLLACNKGLLIGTTEAVYIYTDDGALETLVDYGCVPGVAGDTDAEGTAFFWTVRGVCKAMPFENLTERDIMMNPGMSAVAGMVYLNGLQQFVAVTQGTGEVFNSRTERV